MTKKKTLNRQKQEYLSQLRLEQSAHKMLLKWKGMAQIIILEREKAVPFYEEVILSKRLQQSFYQLAAYVEHRREKKDKMEQSFDFYRFNLLSKSIESLAWYRNLKQSR